MKPSPVIKLAPNGIASFQSVPPLPKYEKKGLSLLFFLTIKNETATGTPSMAALYPIPSHPVCVNVVSSGDLGPSCHDAGDFGPCGHHILGCISKSVCTVLDECVKPFALLKAAALQIRPRATWKGYILQDFLD